MYYRVGTSLAAVAACARTQAVLNYPALIAAEPAAAATAASTVTTAADPGGLTLNAVAGAAADLSVGAPGLAAAGEVVAATGVATAGVASGGGGGQVFIQFSAVLDAATRAASCVHVAVSSAVQWLQSDAVVVPALLGIPLQVRTIFVR